MPARSDRLLLFAFVLSGAAALGYEILWTWLLGIAFGSETLGVLGVLAGFFGGMALGAWLLNKRARECADPVKLFAILEGIAAAFALASPHLLYFLARRLPVWLGPGAGDNDTPMALILAIGTAGIVLLPGTLCMGATLAALVEARRRARPADAPGEGVGRLYAANTLGATVGTLATIRFVLPEFGMVGGSVLLSGLGAASIVVALLWARGDVSRDPSTVEPPPGRAAGRDGLRAYLMVVAASGLTGVGLEVVGVQILSQVMENTVYTFANVLSVYLLGTAVGATLYSFWARRSADSNRDHVTAVLLLALGFSVLLMGAVLPMSKATIEWIAPPGSAWTTHMQAELAAAAIALAVPTILMGALFSHLVGVLSRYGVGKAYALNTVGSTLAPFVCGVVLLRVAGYTASLYSVAGLYLALFLAFALIRKVKSPHLWIAAAALVVGMLAPRSMTLVQAPAGWRELERREGLFGAVLVTESTAPVGPRQMPLRKLQVNSHFYMGGGVGYTERRMGHMALVLKPRARTALFLGLGTAVTLGAVRSFPRLERIEAVEIVPEVLDMLKYFDAQSGAVRRDPRIAFHAADARRHLAASRSRFDIIVADLYHPARDGAGGLFSLEHFEAARDHLEPDGLFVQWLPLYQIDEKNLKTIVRTFLEAFPEVHSILSNYNASMPVLGLLGRVPRQHGDSFRIDPDWISLALKQGADSALMGQWDVLAEYAADRGGLAAFAGEGPLNTDLDPRVLFDAPRSFYERDTSSGWSSLAALLPHRTLYPETWLPEAGEEYRKKIAGFKRAVDLYLEAELLGLSEAGAPDSETKVLRILLDSYEAEPGFLPTRGRLFTLARSRPDEAEPIFRRMLAISPDEIRVYQARLAHYQSTKNLEAFNRYLKEARARFGDALTKPPK